MRWSLLVCAPLFAGCVCLPARGQEPLTLPEALRLAAERNEVPRIAAARIDAAEALRREAYGLLLPSVTVSAAYIRRAREVSRQIEDERVVLQAQDALDATGIAEVDLFDPTNLPEIRRTTRLLEAERLDAGELSRSLAFDVAASFFAVLSAEELEAAAATRVEVAERTLADARGRFEVGLAARNEVTRTELELASARLARTTADSTVRTSRLALGYLIGEPALGPLAPPPEAEVGAKTARSGEPSPEPPALDLPATPPTPPSEVASLEAQARADRSDVVALERRAEAARLAAAGTRYALFPSLRLRGTWTATNEAGLSGQNSDWNLAALLSWNVYDGGVRLARAAGLEAARRELQLQAEALGREVSQDVRRALADLETAQAAVQQAAVAQRVARENAEEVRELFRQGLATALEQADANVSEFEASADLARQGFALQLARLSLRQAVGDWPEGAELIEKETR